METIPLVWETFNPGAPPSGCRRLLCHQDFLMGFQPTLRTFSESALSKARKRRFHLSFPPFSRLLCIGLACTALVGCTDDIALVDALPGTWRIANGDLITFTRSETLISSGDGLYQGRVVVRGGGLVDAVTDSVSACRGVGEIGFLWAVEDLSLYGNMAFAVDPRYASSNSSGACQSTGVGFSYPVIETAARSFTIGTPEIEFLGIPAGPLETFTAELLVIDGIGEGLSDRASGVEAIALDHEVELGHHLDLRDIIRPLPVSE